MARSIKYLVYVAASLCAALALLWGAARFFRDELRLKAEATIDKHVDAQVAFSDLSISLLKDFPNITITLHDLVVSGNREFVGDTLAKATEFDMEIKTSSLFYGRKTELKSIHLYNPVLSFKILENGHENYDIFRVGQPDSTSTSKSSSLNITLDEVRISDGLVRFSDLLRKMEVLLTDVDHLGSGDFQKDLFDFTTDTKIGELSLSYGKIRVIDQKEVEVQLVTEINLSQRSLTLKENHIRVNHFTVALEGGISLLEDGYNFDLSFNTKKTDFKNIISLVPGIFMKDFKQITTKGELAVNGFVIGEYSSSNSQLPQLLADFKVTDAMFKIDTLPDPIENIQMEFVISNLYGHPDSTIFDLKNFQFDMRKHVVKGRLKFQGLDRHKIDADVFADVDLAELEKMYPIKGIELKGDASFELKAKGPLALGRKPKMPSFHLNMRLNDGKIKYDHLPAAIDSIQFHLVADNPTGDPEKSVYDFRRLHMDLDKNRVRGFLKLEGHNNLKVKTDLNVDLDLADLETMFPMNDVVMKGIVKMDIKGEGIYNDSLKQFPSLIATGEIMNGYLKTPGYAEPFENVHFSGEVMNATGHFKDTRLAISRLTYTLEDEPFDVSGTISDLENYKYDLKIDGKIDLEKMTRIYPLAGLSLKGLITSQIESRGQLSDIEEGHYEKIKSKGRVIVNGFSAEGSDFKHPVTIDSASFLFSPRKIILEKMKARAGRSTVDLSGDLYNYMSFLTRSNKPVKCDLKLKCDTLDVNEWLSEEVAVAQKRDSSVYKVKMRQVPLNLDMTFDSEIAHVFYEDITITELDGEIRVKDGVLTLHETGFNSLNAEFSVSGNINTRDMNHPQFDAVLDIKELDINKAYTQMKPVRELCPSARDARGMFSINYKLKGEFKDDFYPKMETLAGGGEIRVAHAQINGMKIFEELSKASKKSDVNDPHLRDFVMRSSIKDNKIMVEPFSIKVSSFGADVEGVSEISGAIYYLVKLELPPLGIKVPFHVTGTYDNPKVVIGKGHSLPVDSVAN
ncbi:MAG TPA: AsmA-like C-terminal region-containing protein [Cyclobacteriaceae bacterium]|nr:AsmA-like C-terminal region-containing protein [Cyclobacteriaceae bacterium]